MKIYKIIDNTNGNIYIGKTTQTLNKRLAQHKSHKNCMSRRILVNGDYKIELIEETDDKSRERYWIENTDCINIMVPGRTHKEWYLKNKERLSEDRKEYYQVNREKKLEYERKKYENNKEKIRNYQSMARRYRKSWGEYNNNLLKIHPDLFIV